MSFPVGDLSRGIAGQRVHIQLPKVTIRAGAWESVFLPSIPRIIDDVRVYVASVSKKHPLSAFQITLQDGYQLPGGPGTVWSDREQRRIKELMSVLNREDELHNRYLKKLATLESEIESSAERILTVRKELEDSKTRVGQER